MSKTKEFQWTDELVKEYTRDIIVKAINEGAVYPLIWQEKIEQFKQSKSIKEQKEETRLEKLERVADTLSRVYYFGGFKAETVNERMLEELLTQLGYWPTTESEILKRNDKFPPTPQPEPETTKRFARHWVEIAEQPKERIVISEVGEYEEMYPAGGYYQFFPSETIHPNKFPAIKSALEAVLNDDVAETKTESVIETVKRRKEECVKKHDFETASNWRQIERIMTGLPPIGEFLPALNVYTEQQLREAEEKAFEASRIENSVHISNNMIVWPAPKRFPTFQDYLNYKQ